MANRANFGAPNTGTGSSYKNFKLQPGSNHYRIGPAFKSLAASGKWFVFLKQHFGYRSTGNDQNPNGFMKVFVCPQEKDRKTEMVRVPCAECDERERIEGIVDARVAKMTSEGKTAEQIDAVVGNSREWLKAHNLDKKYLVLAKSEKNEWGVLALPYKAKEALDNRRKKIQAEEGIDILAIENGAWLDFTRDGEGFKTTYGCDVVYEVVDVNGRKAKSVKLDTLVDADFDAIEASCPDLSAIGRRLTGEQIDRLVESGGDPEIVDNIFNESRQAREASASASPQPKVTPVVTIEKTEPVFGGSAKGYSLKELSKEGINDPPHGPKENAWADPQAELATLRAKLAALEAQSTVETATETTTAKTPPVVTEAKQTPGIPMAPQNLENLDDAQFLDVLKPKVRR